MIYEPDTKTRIDIHHVGGYNEEQKIKASLIELAEQDKPLIDIIMEANSTNVELERLEDSYYHAHTLLDNIKAHMDKLPRKPLKEDFNNFIMDIKSEIENSLYDF